MRAERSCPVSRPAFEGPLLAGDFIAVELPRLRQRAQSRQARTAHQRLKAAWTRAHAALGPASGLHAVADVAVVPVLAAYGYRARALHRDTTARRAVGAAEGRGGALVGVLVAPWGEDLGGAWRDAVRVGVSQDAPWTLCSNGRRIRLVDARRSWARRFVEFDLEPCALDLDAFAVSWAALAPEALAPRRPSHGSTAGCALDELVSKSSRHGTRVCSSLQRGVRSALELLAAALAGPMRCGAAPPAVAWQEALTVVFRLLFLLYAEARTLVPVWHPVYRASYSIESLRDAIARGVPARGTWEAVQAIARLAHAGCAVDTLRVNAFNGHLFAPSDAPLAERARVPDEVARRVLVDLTMTPPARGIGRRPVAYADLGVEQLGAVYEQLIDRLPLEDGVSSTPRGAPLRPRARSRAGSSLRKSTGTFYTPRPMTDYLVRRTLCPLVESATPDDVLALRVVDPAMGSGAFLVSACLYLASAYEAALVRHGQARPGDLDEADRSGFRRLVAQRCLYGVDLNPTAVHLARLSLWLTTLAADAPLTFLDHRLCTGNSLVGASPADLARQPAGPGRGGRAPAASLPLFEPDELAATWRSCVPTRLELACRPDDSAATVRAKERSLRAVSEAGTAVATWRQMADLWCAPWFWDAGVRTLRPAAFAALCDDLRGRPGQLPRRERQQWLDAAQGAARRERFFHWPLEFPEVFVAADGTPRPDAGFDAVLGNPPWDVVRADAGDGPAREAARHQSSRLARFVHGSGIYGGATGAHVNCYQLFVERALALARDGGRLGLVVPWGLLADHGSAALRRRLIERCHCDAVVAFDNRRGLFPIHRSTRFALVTATTGGRTDALRARLRETDPAALESLPDEGAPSAAFPLRIPVTWLRDVAGDHLAVPDLATPGDVALLDRLSRSAPSLASPRGWHATFGRELNATEDRDCFRAEGAVPVVEGKHLVPFRADVSRATRFVAEADAARRVRPGGAWLRSRLGYRDVASATNRLTVIAAVLPARTVSTHTVFCLKTPIPEVAQWFLCGVLNSYVFNYLARLWVTTHVTVALVERLPVPHASECDPEFAEVSDLARRIARGVAGSSTAHARLQARVARLYGLDEEGFATVLASFPLVDPAIRDAARAAFRQRS